MSADSSSPDSPSSPKVAALSQAASVDQGFEAYLAAQGIVISDSEDEEAGGKGTQVNLRLFSM